MRTLINSLAVVGAIVAVALTLNLYLGVMGGSLSEDRSTAVPNLQLWGAIAVLAALVFGYVGRLMDRRVPRPASKFSNAAIALGLLCGALIFAMPFVFG